MREIRVSPITGGVRIEIPSPRQWLHAIAIGVWLFIWIGGILAALGEQPQPGKPVGYDMLFFVFFGLAAAAFGVVSGLWAIAGREVLEVDTRSFRVGTEIPFPARNLGRAKAFDRALVRNLRFELEGPAPGASWSARTAHGGHGKKFSTNSCFDYGKETVRFGQDVTAPDAGRVIAAVTARFPIP